MGGVARTGDEEMGEEVNGEAKDKVKSPAQPKEG
jgi:hypothetical protein